MIHKRWQIDKQRTDHKHSSAMTVDLLDSIELNQRKEYSLCHVRKKNGYEISEDVKLKTALS